MINFIVADVAVARIGLSILFRTHKERMVRDVGILAFVVAVAGEATKMKTTMMILMMITAKQRRRI